MKIYLRLSKGWSKPIKNHGKETCDLDGSKLWISPGNLIYCDLEHDMETVSKLAEPRNKATAIKF